MEIPEIYSQSHLDGGCFIHSIANAYRSLTGNHIEADNDLKNRWNRALLNIPYSIDFLLCDVGTSRYNIGDRNFNFINDKNLRGKRPEGKTGSTYDMYNQHEEEDHTLFLLAIRTICYELSSTTHYQNPKLDVSYIPRKEFSTRRDLSKHIDENSVLIYALYGKTDNQTELDHWVAITGYNNDLLELQCSYIFINRDRNNKYEYVEKKGYRNRLFNDWISQKNLDIKTEEEGGPIFKIYSR